MFCGAIIILNFEINHKYIEVTFCEKKNIPNNSCHGRCYLKKQLEHEEGTTVPNSNVPQKEKPDDFLFCQKIIPFSLQSYKEINKPKYYEQTNLYFRDYVGSVFHPPKTC